MPTRADRSPAAFQWPDDSASVTELSRFPAFRGDGNDRVRRHGEHGQHGAKAQVGAIETPGRATFRRANGCGNLKSRPPNGLNAHFSDRGQRFRAIVDAQKMRASEFLPCSAVALSGEEFDQPPASRLT